MALEGLRSLNPNLVPAGLHAALVRAIALAIRDIVPDVVTLSPRGIAVGGALVHPFLAPAPKPPGNDWFLLQMRMLAAVEGEIVRTSRPRPQPRTWEALSAFLDATLEDMHLITAPDKINPQKELSRVLSAARDALLHPDIAPAWAWVVISRVRLLQLQAGMVKGPPAFHTYLDALNFIRQQHLANYIHSINLEEVTREEEAIGSAEMPDFRGVLNDFLGDVDPHGFDPLLAGKKWKADPAVLQELVKAFEIARKANLHGWLSVDYHAFPVLEEVCRKGIASGTPVEMSYHDVRVLAELVQVVDDSQGDQDQISDDIHDALWERHWVATARAALHAIQLAPRLAEAWVQLAQVVNGPEDPQMACLFGRVRGRLHARLTEFLCGGKTDPKARTQVCLENAVYLDVTCEEAWVALARVPSPSMGLKTLRMAIEILPASRLLRNELQAKENLGRNGS